MTRLSPREMQVARLVAEDLPDKTVAEILQISPRTVQQYLDRMAKKIGAGASTVARRRAIRQWVESAEREAHEAA